MADKIEEGEDVESDSGDSFIDDSENDEPSTSGQDDGLHLEAPLTEKEIEDLIAELLEVESKAAEAQESLEDESLARVEVEVKEELAQSLKGEDLEKAVKEEMEALKEEWETVLDDLETESSQLLEQLDCAGIELPSLYKWIESQAPNGCCTEAWKSRTHWVGSHVTSDVTELVADAEKYLQTHRPVRRRHGKTLEEGASGFLGKRLATADGKEVLTGNSEAEWNTFHKMISSSADSASFGSKNWASVYLASTPQQAAELGLNFPGVDEVEEIDDIEGSLSYPFIADAVVNEQELNLSEEQRRNFKKVREEDDINHDRKLQRHLKRKRQKKRLEQGIIKDDVSGDTVMDSNLDHSTPIESLSLQNDSKNDIASKELKNGELERNKSDIDMQNQRDNGARSNIIGTTSPDSKSKVLKRPLDDDELCATSKKSRVVILDSDDDITEDKSGVASDTADQSDLKGNGDDTNVANDPCDSLNEDFHCTACNEVVTDVHRHPLLEVIVCRSCRKLIESKMQGKDGECSECYCGWCGRNSELVSCRSCRVLFCTSCVKRNLGEKCLLEVKASGWRCCCCTPSMLHQLSSKLEKALMSSSESSSESDSDDSDEDVNTVVSTKRRRKKFIRRIIDDTELGEETKRKIAIEKERQDRLKSLEAKFSTKSMMSNPGFTRTLPKGDTIDVLGDALSGYIVNVVREEGEGAVRIPPSISTKLKAHQIAGIRFMWENIIQSISKVKSGDKGLGCILAHTMGLGKTLQVITFLYAAMRSVDLGLKTAIIVMPVNVLHNWRHEFLKWRPSELKPLRVFMLEDVPRDRRAELLMKWRSKGGVFLISYTAFRNLSLGKYVKEKELHVAKEIRDSLQDGADILVCDEAHMIKNTKAGTTQALKLVKCQRRIALTGSPLQNNLMEYYCMVDFVREGFLGSSQEFRNRFQNPIENGQHTNSTSNDVKIMNQRSHILYEQLKGFVQRMDMNVVKKDLPPKTVFVIAVKLSSLQRKLYRRFLDVHGFTSHKVTNEKISKSFFAGYQALAQIWNHPRILQLMNQDKDFAKREDATENFLADDSSSDDNMENTMINGEKLRSKNDLPTKKQENGFFRENWWNDLLQEVNFEVETSGKMVLLLDILSMSSDAGDKALVFSQSISTLDLIEHYLSKLPRSGKTRKCWKQGKDWYRLDGRTPGSERQKLVEKFNDPSNKRVKCTLISTRAGSLGINLYAANRVIIVDGSWNPTHDLQAIYRAWRYGQKKQVFAYRLMAYGTMEEKIYKRQVTKESLAARVVDRQQVHRTISKEELLHLFDFVDDENPDTSAQLDQPNGRVETFSSDKLMESLLGKHCPRWIANYHEHETFLQENEDEKLSKEEQDMAWEVYQRTLEWEEVHGVPYNESSMQQAASSLHESSHEQKPLVPNAPVPVPKPKPESKPLRHSKWASRNHSVPRKCTNISHVLTLKSQGTKIGCSTVCGECAQEISWENLTK